MLRFLILTKVLSSLLNIQSEEMQDNNRHHLYLVLLTVVRVKAQQQLTYLNTKKVTRRVGCNCYSFTAFKITSFAITKEPTTRQVLSYSHNYGNKTWAVLYFPFSQGQMEEAEASMCSIRQKIQISSAGVFRSTNAEKIWSSPQIMSVLPVQTHSAGGNQ